MTTDSEGTISDRTVSAIPIVFLHPGVDLEYLGLLPYMLDARDPRSAREQFHDGYAHGGGWQPMQNFTMEGRTLLYPGDPPFNPSVMMKLRDETIYVYQFSIVVIVQPDGSFEVARMD